METEIQICFGARKLEINRLVHALEAVLRRRNVSLEWTPNAQVEYCGWSGYPDGSGWIYMSSPELARGLAREIAVSLDTDLNFYEARCESTSDDAQLSYASRIISRAGKIMPMPRTRLDGTSLESVTVGYTRDRLEQILQILTEREASPNLSHTFQLYYGQTDTGTASVKSKPREGRIRDVLTELANGVSAQIGRESATQYAITVKTTKGYFSTIYANDAEIAEIQARLSPEARQKVKTPSVAGPLDQQ